MSGVRVFRPGRANVKQITHKEKFRFSDLHLIKGRGVARTPRLGHAAVQKEVLIKSFQGTVFQRSQRYASIFEAKHARSDRLGVQDSMEHFVRQILLSQGPLTAERTYAAMLDLSSSSDIQSPHRAMEILEKLRIERYLFRLTMKRWRKLCAAAGRADGSEVSFDKRAILDEDFVYIPREVYLPIAEPKRSTAGRAALFYQPGLQPSLQPSAEAQRMLPVMASVPTDLELASTRADYLEDMRARWRRLTSNPALFKGYPHHARYSIDSDWSKNKRAMALAAMEERARNYGKEPYAEEDFFEQYETLPASPEASAG